MFNIQVTRGVNPKTSADQGGGPSSLAAETTYISAKEERGPKGGGWKGRLTQALQTRPQTPGSAVEGFLEVIILSLFFFLFFSFTFTICYRIVFDIPRPAVLLIRGHELHLTTYLLFLYNISSQIQQAHSNIRTLAFEHSDKGAVDFRFPAFLRFTLSGTRCCLPRTQGLQRVPRHSN